jgi:hypothetical protein
MKEAHLLTGPLEPTNRPYALAKIAGIEMCWSYNRQYGTQYLAVMPTNLYGPGDNYHPENSHVIPALIRRFHEAKLANAPSVTVWGTGTPKREFLYSEDMADACVYLMNLPDEQFVPLLGQEAQRLLPPLMNIGVGHDLTIRELAETVARRGYSNSIPANVVGRSTAGDGTPRKLMDVANAIEPMQGRLRIDSLRMRQGPGFLAGEHGAKLASEITAVNLDRRRLGGHQYAVGWCTGQDFTARTLGLSFFWRDVVVDHQPVIFPGVALEEKLASVPAVAAVG